MKARKTNKSLSSHADIEATLVDRAIKSAVREAVLTHQRLGRAVVGSDGEKIVWVKPGAPSKATTGLPKTTSRRRKAG